MPFQVSEILREICALENFVCGRDGRWGCFAPGRGTFVEIQKYPKNLRGFGPGPHGEPSKNMQNTVRRGQKTGYLFHPRPLPLCVSEIGACFSRLKARLWVNNRGALRPYLPAFSFMPDYFKNGAPSGGPAGQVGKRQLPSVFAAIEAGCIAYPP